MNCFALLKSFKKKTLVTDTIFQVYPVISFHHFHLGSWGSVARLNKRADLRPWNPGTQGAVSIRLQTKIVSMGFFTRNYTRFRNTRNTHNIYKMLSFLASCLEISFTRFPFVRLRSLLQFSVTGYALHLVVECLVGRVLPIPMWQCQSYQMDFFTAPPDSSDIEKSTPHGGDFCQSSLPLSNLEVQNCPVLVTWAGRQVNPDPHLEP